MRFSGDLEDNGIFIDRLHAPLLKQLFFWLFWIFDDGLPFADLAFVKHHKTKGLGEFFVTVHLELLRSDSNWASTSHLSPDTNFRPLMNFAARTTPDFLKNLIALPRWDWGCWDAPLVFLYSLLGLPCIMKPVLFGRSCFIVWFIFVFSEGLCCLFGV